MFWYVASPSLALAQGILWPLAQFRGHKPLFGRAFGPSERLPLNFLE